MHVVVLGAGVIGVTTAYYLTERGHTVTVVDHAAEVASGASGGNGGQLSYSFTDAMASPALLTKLPGILAGRYPAFFMRPSVNTQLIRWGLAFLTQCTSNRNQKNTLSVLQLALRSRALIKELHSTTSVQFSYRQAGKLVMQDSPAAMAEARKSCELKSQLGCDAKVVSIQQATDIEPALEEMKNNYAGAIYSKSDEVGNSQEFTAQLSQWLSLNRDTRFKLNTRVSKIVSKNDRLVAVETDSGTLEPDAVVICLGAWSKRLLDPLGIRTNIYPMRGYSVTLPSIKTSNFVSITDPGSKTVFSRLGDQVRIAGFADFVGYRTGRDAQRARLLLETARKTAPAIADFSAVSAPDWGGFRPMTPNNQPLIGPCSVKGVHLNTGHGMLGWTLACVSGHDVAAGIEA